MSELFTYLDYRAYLREFFEQKKKQNSFFSYRYFGSKVGIDAGNLVKIFQNERHVSPKAVPRIAGYLKFTARESKYFEALVQFAKAKNEKKSRELFERLVNLRNVEPAKVSPHHYEFYRTWYYTAVLAHLSITNFAGDFKKLGNSLEPQITAKEAQEAVERLCKLMFIKQQDDGRFILSKNLISTGEKWQSVAIRGFQNEMLQLAQRSLDHVSTALRDISTLTLGISADDLDEIKRLGKEYRKRVLEIANDCENPDRIYQLNMQVFPLSKISEAGNARR